jgi:hypothetical protein
MNLVLEINLWCDAEGSLLILPKHSRIHVWFSSVHHDLSVLFVPVEVLVRRQTVK